MLFTILFSVLGLHLAFEIPQRSRVCLRFSNHVIFPSKTWFTILSSLYRTSWMFVSFPPITLDQYVSVRVWIWIVKGYIPSSPYTKCNIKSGIDCFRWKKLQSFRWTPYDSDIRKFPNFTTLKKMGFMIRSNKCRWHSIYNRPILYFVHCFYSLFYWRFFGHW